MFLFYKLCHIFLCWIFFSFGYISLLKREFHSDLVIVFNNWWWKCNIKFFGIHILQHYLFFNVIYKRFISHAQSAYSNAWFSDFRKILIMFHNKTFFIFIMLTKFYSNNRNKLMFYFFENEFFCVQNKYGNSVRKINLNPAWTVFYFYIFVSKVILISRWNLIMSELR